MEDFEREIKVVIVGNGGVGKTSMIRRFCRGVFTDTYKKTIGVDFLEKQLYLPSLGEDIHMFLWDTAGQEEFDSITKTYYRGAGAAVIAFSTTDRASFEAVPTWKSKIQAECGDIAMVLVQNKVDLIDQAVVSSEEAEAMARRMGLKFYRACVKENLNVTEAFTYLAELYDRKVQSGQLGREAAVPTLPQIASSSTASADSSRPENTTSAPMSSAAPSTAVPTETVTAEVVPALGTTDKKPSWVQRDSSRNGMPASVELQPSKQRGKKTLKQKLGKAKAKLGIADGCSIM